MKVRNAIFGALAVTAIVFMFQTKNIWLCNPKPLATSKSVNSKKAAEDCIKEITSEMEEFVGNRETISQNYNQKGGGLTVLAASMSQSDLREKIKTSWIRFTKFPKNIINGLAIMDEYHKTVLQSADIIVNHKSYHKPEVTVKKSHQLDGQPFEGAVGNSAKFAKALPPIPGTGGPGQRGKIQ